MLSILEEKRLSSQEILQSFGQAIHFDTICGPFGNVLHAMCAKMAYPELRLALRSLSTNFAPEYVAKCVNMRNSSGGGNTPLHILFSIFGKDPSLAAKIAFELIGKGQGEKSHAVDANAVNDDGLSPFLLAVKKDQLKCVKFCLDYNSVNLTY